jgi:hypothetical protein
MQSPINITAVSPVQLRIATPTRQTLTLTDGGLIVPNASTGNSQLFTGPIGMKNKRWLHLVHAAAFVIPTAVSVNQSNLCQSLYLLLLNSGNQILDTSGPDGQFAQGNTNGAPLDPVSMIVSTQWEDQWYRFDDYNNLQIGGNDFLLAVQATYRNATGGVVTNTLTARFLFEFFDEL